MLKRKPDFIVGTEADPYLLRWWIIPRNRFFNIYLHKFLRDDDDRALHDHPWASLSIILRGGYIEHLPGGLCKHRNPGALVLRRPSQAHRVELCRGLKWPRNVRGLTMEVLRENFAAHQHPRPAWTLFITGPRVREWGFHCPQGWRHWREFTKPDAPGEVGPGCE